jgi:hypothetical protein
MQNLVRASGRKVWYLNDPIEDNLSRTWSDYRTNWESTLVASLLQPEVWRFEVMPWPERVFNGKYPTTQPSKAGEPVERAGIPASYETELQAVISAMGDLKQPGDRIRWEACGTQGAGVLVSDTMMFQRGDPTPSDASLGSFYGLAMPLLKRGFPIEPVQIENATTPGFLDRYKLLLLTYEGQKPPKPEFHAALANWVKAGGALVMVDDDTDPYNAVQEWWNTPPLSFATPRLDLFQALGLAPGATGLSRVGKGVVLYEPLSPAALTHDKTGAEQLRKFARQAAEAVGMEWKESSGLALRRGPYLIAAGLDESLPKKSQVTLRGKFISLFDSGLPLVKEAALTPGRRLMLLDLASPTLKEGVIAAACRVKDQTVIPGTIRFHTDGVAGSEAVVCVLSQQAPREVAVGGKPLTHNAWEFTDGLLRLRFENSAEGVEVEISR